jgi:hypothetical protein
MPTLHMKNKCVSNCVRFEVFTAMTMQETVFWDLAPCILGVCKHLLIYSHRDSPALMMEAIRSYETSVLTKNTRRKIPEDGFLRVSNSLN